MTSFSISVSQSVRSSAARSAAWVSPGVGPGSPLNDRDVGDEHEGRDRERGHQAGELEPEAAGSQPRPDETGLRAQAAAEREQRAQSRDRVHAPDQRGTVLGHPQIADREHDRDHHPDDEAEHKQAPARQLCCPVDVLRDQVAEQGEPGRPETCTEDAVRQEGRVAHSRAAGDERGEGADEADEAPDQDRLAAVALEVRLDLGEALRRDPQLRSVAEDEVPPEPGAKDEAHRVTGPGAEPDHRDHQLDRVLTLAGERPADDHRRLAGEDEADEGAGLEEGEQADQRVAPVPEVVGEVGEKALDVEARRQLLEGDEAAAEDDDQRQQPELVAASLLIAAQSHGRIIRAAAAWRRSRSRSEAAARPPPRRPRPRPRRSRPRSAPSR